MLKSFKNKKLATLIIVFLMVFVVTGAFAAFQRLLLINARVNLFAPRVEIVWADAELYEGPPLWAPDTAETRSGLGLPGAAVARPQYFDRNWPAADAQAVALGNFEAHATGMQHAWWRLAHSGTEQHALAGTFPDEERIEQSTLAEPVEYLELWLGMVFDKPGQEYVFELSLGNPGSVTLFTTDVNVRGEWIDANLVWDLDPDTYRPIGYPDCDADGTPAVMGTHDAPHGFEHNGRDLIEVDYDDLIGVEIGPGQIVTAQISFEAVTEVWEEFFQTDAGEYFLDNHFEDDVAAFFALEVVASLSPN